MPSLQIRNGINLLSVKISQTKKTNMEAWNFFAS
jgi:hypothetical protein